MMATENSDERQFLHKSLRSQMGYGTAALSAATKKSTPKTRKFISRQLLRTDTLMGIALKYGVTVQDLKKENKIWNSDHLFLRETLLIPLTPDNGNLLDENDTIVIFDGHSSSSASPSSSHSHLSNGDDAGSASSSASPDSVSSASTGGTKIRSHSTPSEFFSKYDSNIAQLKGDVAKMEKNAASLEDTMDGGLFTLPSPQKDSRSSRRHSNSSSSPASDRKTQLTSEEDINSSPVLHVKSLTSNKHVKSALENLEQASDDIYEL